MSELGQPLWYVVSHGPSGGRTERGRVETEREIVGEEEREEERGGGEEERRRGGEGRDRGGWGGGGSIVLNSQHFNSY